MYRYDEIDQRLVDERVAQFRDQTRRFLAGKLSEDDFRPLRLRNGLYIQRFAPMLRVAIPYGLLASRQLRTLAHIARTWDRGYGHFSTRQNIQFNWPRLEDVPDDGGAAHATAHDDAETDVTPRRGAVRAGSLRIAHRLQPDVVEEDGGAIGLRAVHRDLELARQEGEFGV